MNSLVLEDFIAISFFIILVNWAISTITFRKVSVDYLDRKLREEGYGPAGWDKGYGTRIITYAIVIVKRKVKSTPLVDEYSVKRHARSKDVKLAWYYHASSAAMIFFTVLLFTLS